VGPGFCLPKAPGCGFWPGLAALRFAPRRAADGLSLRGGGGCLLSGRQAPCRGPHHQLASSKKRRTDEPVSDSSPCRLCHRSCDTFSRRDVGPVPGNSVSTPSRPSRACRGSAGDKVTGHLSAASVQCDQGRACALRHARWHEPQPVRGDRRRQETQPNGRRRRLPVRSPRRKTAACHPSRRRGRRLAHMPAVKQ